MTPTTHDSGAHYFLQGDKKISFTDLYEAHWRKLCSIGNAITGDQEATKDLVQDVFCSFLQKYEGKEVHNVSAYLTQALRYECLHWLRDGKIADRHLLYLSKADADTGTEDSLNVMFLSDKIEKIIASMPERPREIFKLSRFEHLPNDEIAKLLNINRRTVENHLTRALQILRMSLKGAVIIFVEWLQ